MVLYLSSYLLGVKESILKDFAMTKGNKLALFLNATDGEEYTDEAFAEKKRAKSELFEKLGFVVTVIDLRDYFNRADELAKKLCSFNAFFATGGNTFVLRQAMRQSGFDTFLKKLLPSNDHLYGGYSAGICVLAKNLQSVEIVDDPTVNPYGMPTIWEGIGILDYLPIPHYKSDHPEAAMVDNSVDFCLRNNLPFITLRDGEVITLDTVTKKEQHFTV